MVELSVETIEFIRSHRNDDVRRLALGHCPEGVDLRKALVQIAGLQAASAKIPDWAACDGIIWPEHISMEQCSSQQLARFKTGHIIGNDVTLHRMADLTGGLGVDFFYLSEHYEEAFYNEMSPELCEIASVNLPALGRVGATVCNSTAEAFIAAHRGEHFGLLYIDPARRSQGGRKLVSLKDCQPDITVLQEDMLAMSDIVMVKMSPMLDVRVALTELSDVSVLWVLSLDGECKELLAVMRKGCRVPARINAVDITSDGADRDILSSTIEADSTLSLPLLPTDEQLDGLFLYEPYASYMKSGLYRTLCHRYGVCQLHPNSHLFVSAAPVTDFPGRAFRICAAVPADRRSAQKLFTQYPKANIAVRNFPMTSEEIRARYHVQDGGENYIFATTVCPDRKILLLTEKIIHLTD